MKGRLGSHLEPLVCSWRPRGLRWRWGQLPCTNHLACCLFSYLSPSSANDKSIPFQNNPECHLHPLCVASYPSCPEIFVSPKHIQKLTTSLLPTACLLLLNLCTRLQLNGLPWFLPLVLQSLFHKAARAILTIQASCVLPSFSTFP